VKNRSNVWILGVMLVLAPLAGCNTFVEKEPQKSIHKVTGAANEVADSLHGVRDAATAQKAIATLDSELSQLASLLDDVPRVRRACSVYSRDGSAEAGFDRSMRDAFARIRAEMERLEDVSGLPVEFWRMLDSRLMGVYKKCPLAQMTGMVADINEYHEFGADGAADQVSPSVGSTEMFNPVEWHFTSVQNLQQKYGYEHTVRIKFTNTRKDLAGSVRSRLLELSPGAMIFRRSNGDQMYAELGPVADFTAFVAAIDFGDVVRKNESRRSLTISVRPTVVEQWQHKKDESRKQREKAEEEKHAAEHAAATHEAIKKNKEDLLGGDPDDPNYYGKLAENMRAGDLTKRRQALEILMKTSPEQVSADAKKQIARAFKRLAEQGDAYEKAQAVKGLVIWGGKFSGPILLKLLENAKRHEQRSIIEALGKIKYAGAAQALTERLGDSILRDEATAALRKLGSDAEDALLAAVSAENTRVCLAAIELLGDCGTEKSLPVLRRGLARRDPKIRDALKATIRKIVARQKETKSTDGE
jgi:hypothetical protein